MTNEIVELSEKLVRLKTIPGNAKALNASLQLIQQQVKNFTIEEFEQEGVRSILVHNAAKRPRKFKVILNGHLDIIPGKEHQYQPVIKKKKLYGVGTMDMKANLACMLFAFKDVAKAVDYPLALQVVTDEETGGFLGTKYQIDQGVRSEFVIAGETTNFNIVHEAKGVIWLKISHSGLTAHGAYPWKGQNSVVALSTFLNNLLKKYPVPQTQKWVSTINVSRMDTSNTTFNKIPDDGQLWLDIRYIPKDESKILRDIKKILPPQCKIEIAANEPMLCVKKSNYFLKKLQRVTEEVTQKSCEFYGAQGTSDARHFQRVNCPGVEFGPIGAGIGTDSEWVDIPSLNNYRKILGNFLRRISS
jgi:succinyl-diaminopimelate desuccinylase